MVSEGEGSSVESDGPYTIPEICTIDDLYDLIDPWEYAVEEHDMINAYLSQFAKPITEFHEGSQDLICYNCGDPLSGVRTSNFGIGGFARAKNSDAGSCRTCGTPGKLSHTVRDETGLEIMSIGSKLLLFMPLDV